MKKMMFASLGALAVALTPAAVSARPMTAEDLATLHRVSAPTVSPDGKSLVYQKRHTLLAENKGETALYWLDLTRKGAEPVMLAGAHGKNLHDPQYAPDGRTLYFLSRASGTDQVWRMAMTPIGQPEQVTTLSADVAGYAIAPSGDRIAIWADRNLGCQDFECSSVRLGNIAIGSGRTYDQLFVRHWDEWEKPNERSRLYVFPLEDGKAAGSGTSVVGALVGDTPSKPFGGAEEIAWARDGKTIFFTLREAGRIESTSTNLDIFASPADGSAPPVNLTDANDATDTMPIVSPDGRWLAYAAMKRPGYEADRLVVQLRNIASGETRALTEGWDRSVASMVWAQDGKSLIVTADDTLDHPAFRVDVASGKVTRLTKDGYAGNLVPLRDGGAVLTMNSIQAPDDFYRMDKTGKLARLTAVNAAALAEIDPVTIDRFSFVGAQGDTVWGQIVKTKGQTGKLPVAFLVHGGPQGSFNNSWSYRWNPKVFAAPGYAAVSVDFHGSTGYGQAFTDAINKDWGGKPLEDLKLGLAAAGAKDAQVDITNACALGGSYGGYMMNWIEGNWPDAFKCIVQHDGVFDARAMAYETEELWFDEWEHGGPYFENPEEYEKWNPVNHVTAWKTPMLVIHGANDFRIPDTQGLAAFTALQRRGIPSRLLHFPDENHWVLKPRNSMQWYHEVFAWLGQWTGKD
ncbi:alpha/beta hydrolase family protein [Sphingobium boeckii]|uniref:Dipeptidyl aminopeptidase/acylaminoacyl peptidase n=1 Tax=Sphingobium boeckii TaxID=1082345 RepID=A0A7W9AHL5_9SPHN|nr:S9 family peptidase [Sphingobium boeckii]MBB5685840.1 dipeptidyl aminopeptidase/acylaminoacyl peptidase [Sphingobium boeckii]